MFKFLVLLNLERDISFKQSWISYRSTRLKAKENHNLKKDHEGGNFVL